MHAAARLNIVVVVTILAAVPASAVVTRNAPPATTRAAEGVTVKVVEIDTSPTLVTESFKEVSAAELFAKIGARAGVHFRPQPNELWDMPPVQGQKFTAEFDKQPFWDAIREACEATGLTLQPQWTNGLDPDAISIMHTGSPGRAPTFVAGPFMIRANSIQRGASIRYGDEKSATGPKVRLALQVSVEPRLREHVMLGLGQIDKAVDDAGNSLVEAKPEASGQVQSLQYAPTFSVTMDSPANRGHRIVELRGHFVAKLPGKVLAIEAPWPPALSAPAARKDGSPIAESPLGANHLTMRALPRGQAFEVEVVLQRPEGDAVSDDAWRDAAVALRDVGPKVRITRANDPRVIGYSGVSWGATGERATLRIFTQSLPAEGGPARLHVNLPLEMRSEPVEFTFKDLPLP